MTTRSFDPRARNAGIVAEDERTVESTADEGTDGAASTGEDGTGGESLAEDGVRTGERTPDDAAETFLELDEALDLDDDERTRRGLVVDADRRDAGAVPSGYPVAGDPDEVVALTVDAGERETTVYLAWPGEDADVPLVWLLDAMGVELGDLYGREVRLERVEGHDVLVTPDERPRGSDLQAGVLGGLAFVAGFVALLATGGAPALVSLLWALVTVVGLPYAVYRDAWYVRTHSDWSGGPLFWATLSMLPFLNLPVGLVYLWRRSRARFFGDQRSFVGRAVDTVRSWL